MRAVGTKTSNKDDMENISVHDMSILHILINTAVGRVVIVNLVFNLFRELKNYYLENLTLLVTPLQTYALHKHYPGKISI